MICGLGALGQACLERLLPFSVPLLCLNEAPPQWRNEALRQRFGAELVLGDMRQAEVLQRAGVKACRAVLLLSADNSVNLEAALQVRLLNPHADVVVRSSGGESTLGHLLEQRLPRIAVVDPLLLTAGAVAGALQPGEGLAQLELSGTRERIDLVEGLHEERFSSARPVRIRSGSLQNLWLTPSLQASRAARRPQPRRGGMGKRWLLSRQRLREMLRQQAWRAPRSAASWALICIPPLLLAGALAFSGGGGWRQGLFVTIGLLLGEYVDPVLASLPGGHSLANAPAWHIGGGLLYALLGTVLTSALVALMLERLLSQRLGLRARKAIHPGSRQALLVEGGPLADQVERILACQRIQAHHVNRHDDDTGLQRWLRRLERSDLVGVGLLSSDLLANIHTALTLQHTSPQTRLALLAHVVDGADQLGELLGGITVISGMDVAADALVATAFGERIDRVLRVNGINVLVVRYLLEPDDSLCGRTVSRIENGYGLNVLSVRRGRDGTHRTLPPLEWLLQADDEITVLATLEGLRQVEQATAQPPAWRLALRNHQQACEPFLAQQCLARFLGVAPGQVASWLDGGWHGSDPIDHDLGLRLAKTLNALRIETKLQPLSPSHQALD